MLMAELKYERFRQEANKIIHGTNTKAGRFDLILLGLILLSVLLVMMETVSEFDLKYHFYLVLLEWIITVLFTIEYIFRIISINRPWKYVSSFYGLLIISYFTYVFVDFLSGN
jgi:voltage-gated potassium channel